MHRRWKIAFVLTSLAIIILVLGFTPTDKPKVSFPLDDPSADYSVRKLGPHYGLLFEKSMEKKMVFVGSTPVSLESYVGKKVQVKGRFRNHMGEIPCQPGYEHQCERVKAVVIDINNINVR